MRYSLKLPFDTDNPVFALGFELGCVWGHLQIDDGPQLITMHAANAEMILRIAEATGREVSSTELGNGWIAVQFGAVE